MKKYPRLVTMTWCLLIFFAVALHSACKKEKADKIGVFATTLDFDANKIWQCHEKENPQPSQINTGLTGTWVWQSNKCYWSGDSTFIADKQTVVIFSDGGLYKVFENGAVSDEGTFTLSHAGDNWQIVTNHSNEYLHGYILLCKNELVFFNSYLDGCDYYFTRR